MAQMNLSTEQKQTHRHKEQTCGCKEVQGGTGMEFGVSRHQLLHLFIYLFIYSFLWPHLEAYRSSQARGWIGAAATSLHQRTSKWDMSHFHNLCHSSQQCQSLNALSEARDQACILMDTIQVTSEPEQKLQNYYI